jgi:hypothetical protein
MPVAHVLSQVVLPEECLVTKCSTANDERCFVFKGMLWLRKNSGSTWATLVLHEKMVLTGIRTATKMFASLD